MIVKVQSGSTEFAGVLEGCGGWREYIDGDLTETNTVEAKSLGGANQFSIFNADMDDLGSIA
jgi:hypothetical protein